MGTECPRSRVPVLAGDWRRVAIFVLEHELTLGTTGRFGILHNPSTFLVASVTVEMKHMVGVRMCRQMLAQVVESGGTQQVNTRCESADFYQLNQWIGDRPELGVHIVRSSCDEQDIDSILGQLVGEWRGIDRLAVETPLDLCTLRERAYLRIT